MLFTQIRQPDAHYLVLPRVSTERRKYIPIGFLSPDVIAGDKLQIIPGASLYLFGVLTSSAHMAWTRVVCGRIGGGLSYSPAAYNCFPWPNASYAQIDTIESLARSILDARQLFPSSSLANLYDPLKMPDELLKAHDNMDRAVMELYGFSNIDTPESVIVPMLFERYEMLVKN